MNDIHCRLFHFGLGMMMRPLLVVVLGLLLLTNIASVSAQEAEFDGKKPSDVRMVIDISGSMRKNDPQNLRRPALDMLVKLLPKDSKAGVWTFGQYVNMLIPHRKVDQQWSDQASASAGEIKSIAQFTNIGEALEKAAYDYQSSKTNYQKHIILLTDGMVDINRDPEVNRQERQRIIDEVLPRYQQGGFTLHTIALSDNADKQLMTKLALATDGKVAVAKTAEELMNAFLQVFNQAVPAEELPFNGESFFTDSSIEEFTALIFRQPNTPATEIIAPDQARYTKDTQDSRVVWHHTDKYDLITIKQPLEGEWRVVADLEPQSRITVVSDLSLAVKSMPTNISLDETINTSLALREENQVVTRPEFLQLLDIDVNVSYEGNSKWSQRLSDSIPKNGIYKTLLEQFDQQGQYAVTFTVDGKTFQRQFTHNLSVREPFAVEIKEQESNGQKQFTVEVIPQSQSVDLNQTEVVGKLKKPSGTSHIVSFEATEDGNWSYILTPEESGKYSLAVRVTTQNDSGPMDFTPPPFTLLNQQDDSVFETPAEPEPLPLPEPEPAPVEPVEPEAPEVEEVVEEEVVTEEVVEEPADNSQLILYGILGVVNLLIIVVVYFIYRKLFKKKESAPDDDSDGESPEESGFTEPPMDEMMVEDLDEPAPSEPEPEPEPEPPAAETPPVDDVESEPSIEEPEPESEAMPEMEDIEEDLSGIDLDSDMQDDALAEMLDEETSEEDEMPDFSLDDFGPEGLDDTDEEKKE